MFKLPYGDVCLQKETFEKKKKKKGKRSRPGTNSGSLAPRADAPYLSATAEATECGLAEDVTLFVSSSLMIYHLEITGVSFVCPHEKCR